MTVIVGWSLLLVMWETGVVAVLLAASRLWWPRASAARQYATALAATTAIVVLAVATPLMLTIASSTPAQNLTPPQSFVSGPASELSTPFRWKCCTQSRHESAFRRITPLERWPSSGRALHCCWPPGCWAGGGQRRVFAVARPP